MKATGMTFGKWTSNSDELMQHLEHEDRRVGEGMVVHHKSTGKVLGTTWDSPRGMFLSQISNLLAFLRVKTDVKRFIIQAASGIFDSLGFGPYTMLARLLFQKHSPREIGSDRQLPEDPPKQWNHAYPQVCVCCGICGI
ncbi:hypothetical protein HPB48_016079 [Haemaphysalis longicornis]|uniref:Uncharacterized protein n=1 Tax=Haemaphysalis longicornis TaxID=44386 RepID=A0A9J6GQ89_HAELO|nr:hypothetical protein HPB48_016079 [Haemaphysalis longicornis]